MFREPSSLRLLTFCTFLLIYIIAFVGNFTLIVLIAREKQLHKPVYIFLANLAATDLIGISTALPRVMHNLIVDNTISFPACFTQMVFYHYYIVMESYILSTMAVDRYIAVCYPFRYNVLITNRRAKAMNVAVSNCSICIALIFLVLVLRLNFCRSRFLSNPICIFMALSNHACQDVKLHSIVGITSVVLSVGLSIVVVITTYLYILYECFHLRQRSEGRSKALQTCMTHFMVFSVFVVSILFIVISLRLGNVKFISPSMRYLMDIFAVFIPPVANPLIYGLRTAEIQRGLRRFLRCFSFSWNALNYQIVRVQFIKECNLIHPLNTSMI
uniref:olfactory receptor 52Z1P-like n=1 Tax=Myxine glutinosa TaxID=7769 RepID=UPI00359007FA